MESNFAIGKSQLIRFDEMQSIVKFSRVTIDRWEKAGEFPAKIYIGKRSVAWNLWEVLQWADKLEKSRDKHLECSALDYKSYK